MRTYVKGFGCSSNMADTEVLAGCLQNAGHIIVSSPEKAELVIFNTCAVKTQTENKMIHLLRKVPREKKLVIAGCLPLVNLRRLHREVRFDGVVGPAFGDKIVDVVRRISLGMNIEEVGEAVNMPRLDLPRMPINSCISIIPICYGCLGECAYCCVRFARGKLRSYNIEEITSKVERDLAKGFKEFWLTSQDTACYGKDIGASLPKLLRRISSLSGEFLVRVGMMTPDNFLKIKNELIEEFKSGKIFKFLHIPVQSGDDEILKRMNRRYSRVDFKTIVGAFKEEFPQSTIATDVIVGFPGETKKAFDNTYELIKDTRPDIVNISKFFARPKTSEADLGPRIDVQEMKARSGRMTHLVYNVSFERNREWGRWRGRILVDEIGKKNSVVGRNFAYKPIAIKIDNVTAKTLLGQIVEVKVHHVSRSHLLGERVSPLKP